MRVFILYLLIAFFMAGGVSAFANEGPSVEGMSLEGASVDRRTDGTSFFETLQDVPVMPGLTELEDYKLVFDKPEGRIVEMVAKIEGASIDDVRNYYSRSLPQLGWVMTAPDNYMRGGEHLSFNFEREQNDSFVRMTVQPR